MLLAKREQVQFRSLVKDVVNHLYAVDEAGLDDGQGAIRLMVVDGDSKVADLAGSLQVFNGATPVIALQPLRVPYMELLQVNALHAKVAEALFRAGHRVFVREYIVDHMSGTGGPHLILGRNLGGDHRG